MRNEEKKEGKWKERVMAENGREGDVIMSIHYIYPSLNMKEEKAKKGGKRKWKRRKS